MTHVEYEIVRQRFPAVADLNAALNERAAEGWRLHPSSEVHWVTAGVACVLIFERNTNSSSTAG